MPGTIINKKQFISFRAYCLQGGPGPACTISINGTGVGTYTCPITQFNQCVLSTGRIYGAAIVEGLNHADAPYAETTTRVRGNMPSCSVLQNYGKDQYTGALTYRRQNFSLAYLNMASTITVNFSWASSASWPNCCQRSYNTDLSGYDYGFGHGVYFDIAYRYDTGGSSTVSASYTSLLTWAFSNLKEVQTNCSAAGVARVSRVGGISPPGNTAYGCSTFNPSNPNLTSVTIPCPTCS